MPSITCPSCHLEIMLDFLPEAGLVWCPSCQKMFSQSKEQGARPDLDAQRTNSLSREMDQT
jgi:hypothetical protein